jgi:hypothetical protein
MLGQWSELIQQAATDSGVPWQVIGAVLIVESRGDPATITPSGGIGLMGVRPDLWQAYVDARGGDLWDPWTNVYTGSAVLADLYVAWGTWEQVAAAYIGAIDADGKVTNRPDGGGMTGFHYLTLFRRQAADLGFPISVNLHTGSMGAQTALEMARTTLGTPYVWGGESYQEGGFDCSGLVQWAFTQVGVTLPRTAEEQWDATTRIMAAEVEPGDLIFFINTYEIADPERTRLGTTGQRIITHVGIYAGNGLMLHAPKEGDVVRLTPLNKPYWRARLAGYGRVQ